MGYNRDFFQENWRYPRNISCKDRHDKGQKWQDLTEAEEIKKRWQYTENNIKKVLMTQIITMVWSLTYSRTPWSMTSSGS